MKKSFLVIAYTLGFFTALLGKTLFDLWESPKIHPFLYIKKEKRRGGEIRGIDPLLECTDIHHPQINEHHYPYPYFGQKIKAAIKEKIQKGKVRDLSFYFRDLKDGPFLSFPGDFPFLPGNFTNLPLVIGHFKQSERKQIALLPSLMESVKKTLIFNDPVAIKMLEHADPEVTLQKTAQELDIPLIFSSPPYRPISASELAGFFRILYNATYLDQLHSKEILQLLEQSQFKDGLVAGVPSSVPVAHQWGHTQKESKEGKKVIHFLNDCGIIYYPDHPYVLCLQTRGFDPKELLQTIREMSAMVYQEVQNGRGD